MTARPLQQMFVRLGGARAGGGRRIRRWAFPAGKCGNLPTPFNDLVLRAFRQPFADVRVLIVGQDPIRPCNPVT
jgi:hypothetical protein